MTPHPAQLWLVPPPRRLERGEHECCLRCGRGGDGTYGPPGLESIFLDDGAEHTVRLDDQWLCMRHAKREWAEWRRCQQQLSARRRWLSAHRHVEALGLTAARERYPMVAALLADPTWGTA